MLTNYIDDAYSWYVSDGILYIQRNKGSLYPRVHRSAFVGAAIGWGLAVASCVLLVATESAGLNWSESWLLAVGGAAVWFVMMIPALGFRIEGKLPYRITISRDGVETRGLSWREFHSLGEVRTLRVTGLKTDSLVGVVGCQLLADLAGGESLILVQSRESNSHEQFAPIIDFFEEASRKEALNRESAKEKYETRGRWGA